MVPGAVKCWPLLLDQWPITFIDDIVATASVLHLADKLCWLSALHLLSHLLLSSTTAGANIISILQKKKPKVRKVKGLVQGYTAELKMCSQLPWVQQSSRHPVRNEYLFPLKE